MSELTGKTIFITGGSRGIGQAIGLRFASTGANIVIAAKEELTKSSSASIYTAADQMINKVSYLIVPQQLQIKRLVTKTTITLLKKSF